MSPRERSAYTAYATVVKTQGLRGEVVVSSDHGLPLSYMEGCEVRFVPPSLEGANRASVRSVDEDSRGALVSFEGFDSVDDASKLVGRVVLVRLEDLPQETVGNDGLEGRRVVCAVWGDIGVIEEEMFLPANDVWVVRGPYGEVLVPVIDQVVFDIPEDVAEPVRVKLLPGLIEGMPSGEREEVDG